MEIGSKLKKHRMAQKLTQEDVAQKLHVSRTTISSWETGRTFPDIEKLIYLSDLYALSLDQLIREEPKIMENIISDRQNSKKYKLLKVIGYILLSMFVLYNVYWFSMVYPKNKHLENWEHTEANNYLSQGDYIFQAHDIRYPNFLPHGNIQIATFRGTKFDLTIDGEYAYIGVYDVPRNTLTIPSGTSMEARFKRIHSLTSLEKVMGTLTIDELQQLIEENRDAFDDEYNALEKIWKEVNE